MNVTKVMMTGMKNAAAGTQVVLGRLTALMGPNGSGKSAVFQAIQLVLLGYVPGLAKKGASIMDMAQGDTLDLAVEVQTASGATVQVRRTWVRDAKGSVKETVLVNGVKAAGSAADGMIQLALGGAPALFDGPAFWAMSPDAMKKWLLARSADPASVERILADEVKAKEGVNLARAAVKQAQASLAPLQAKVAAIPHGQDLTALKASIQAKRDALASLKTEHQQGLENDAARAEVAKLAGQVDGIQEELDRCRASVKDHRKLVEQLAATMAQIQEGGSKLNLVQVPQEAAAIVTNVLGVLDRVLKDLGGLTIGATIVKDVRACHDALTHLVPSQAQMAAAAQLRDKMAADYRTARGEHQQAQRELDTYVKRQGQLEAQLAAAKKARGRADKIGPGADPEVGKTIQAQEDELAKLEATLGDAGAHDGLRQALEGQRLATDKATQAEADAKAKHQAEKDALDKLVVTSCGSLAEAASEILPSGVVVVDFDTMTISWARDGRPTVARAALSGGERAVFDAALGRAIVGKAGVILVEGAECDGATFTDLLNYIGQHEGGGQTVVAHWLTQVKAPDGWAQVRMG